MSDTLVLNDRGTIAVGEQEGYLIELVPMLFNWRVVLTPVSHPYVWDYGWCYFGNGRESFARAYLAAASFDLSTMAEPVGFDKRVGGHRATVAS